MLSWKQVVTMLCDEFGAFHDDQPFCRFFIRFTIWYDSQIVYIKHNGVDKEACPGGGAGSHFEEFFVYSAITGRTQRIRDMVRPARQILQTKDLPLLIVWMNAPHNRTWSPSQDQWTTWWESTRFTWVRATIIQQTFTTSSTSIRCKSSWASLRSSSSSRSASRGLTSLGSERPDRLIKRKCLTKQNDWKVRILSTLLFPSWSIRWVYSL